MAHFMPITPSAPAPASGPAPAVSLGLGQFGDLSLPVGCLGAAGWLGGGLLVGVALGLQLPRWRYAKAPCKQSAWQ